MKTFILICVLAAALAAHAQSPSTTTVQGTVYNAAGAPISGTLQLSWPAFTTSANQAIAAGRLTATIGADGFLSVNLAPNMGATPAGLYYTAVYHLADGTTSTEYWVVPAAPQATLAAVRAQVMPAAQAVQAVNKAYVDQAIQQYATNQVSTFGGTLSGPLYLNGDPLIPTQAATKHYVDNQFAQSLPSAGGTATGPLTAKQLGAVYQADQAPGSDFTSRLQACINGLNSTYGGTCDARNFTGSITMSAPLTIATANVTVQLPCATIATAYPIVVTPGTRNVTLHGCATRGTSSASGSQGGTVFLYSGSAALFQIGDSTYAADTSGFHLDNVAINTTAASAATAQALAAWRAQELQLTSLYLLGNSNQTALTLDGTGNYTGGTFQDIQIGGYLTAVNAIGHQVSNPATTDWLNASTFLRLHINCPTSDGNPIAGTVGINLQQGDGNTITGGDVEGCSTALHLGANAQNNTILGLRNENSTSQVVADAGSSYNNWITGGTMFTGRLTDNGTRNSFLDTFHRSFNALNGDWYGSQQDATLTNHFRLGTGSGNERGLLNRYQTDYGYRWTMGLTDATAGEQFYQLLDELNNVNRLSIGQYNNGQASTNNQTVLNSAGSGAIVLNGSNNAGTGGVVIGSGGATSSTVATIDKSGNASFTGTLQVGGTSQSTGPITVRNNADAEVDYYLWPGATTSQKGSFVYRDYNGSSQWYLVKDQSNNWALNSAIGGIDSFKAYQSTNSGDTYVNASNSSGAVRINYESGSGSAFNIYGGNSSNLYAAFTGPAAIKFPGLAASSGHNCMQIDNSGWITNSGSACGTGTVGAGTAGQVAWYSASGTAVTGMAAVPLSAGGTGASTASSALANLGAVPASGGAMTGPLSGTSAAFSSTVAAATTTLGVSTYAAMQMALASTGCTAPNVCALHLNKVSGSGVIALPANWTQPANVQLYFEGGVVQPANAVTATIGSFVAGLNQICDISLHGKCILSSSSVAHPEWFGAARDGATDDAAALLAAATSGPQFLKLAAGTYALSGLALTNQSLDIEGASMYGTALKDIGNSASPFIAINGGTGLGGYTSGFRIGHLTIDGNQQNAQVGGRHALQLQTFNGQGAVLDNLRIINAKDSALYLGPDVYHATGKVFIYQSPFNYALQCVGPTGNYSNENRLDITATDVGGGIYASGCSWNNWEVDLEDPDATWAGSNPYTGNNVGKLGAIVEAGGTSSNDYSGYIEWTHTPTSGNITSFTASIKPRLHFRNFSTNASVASMVFLTGVNNPTLRDNTFAITGAAASVTNVVNLSGAELKPVVSNNRFVNNSSTATPVGVAVSSGTTYGHFDNDWESGFPAANRYSFASATTGSHNFDGGFLTQSIGASVACASTITAPAEIFTVTGSCEIDTINPPYTGYQGTIYIHPAAASFTTGTTGNIANQLAVTTSMVSLTYAYGFWYAQLGAWNFANSLVRNGNTVQLAGDSAAPGNNAYYGTNGSGTRGFYALPASALSTYSVATLPACNSTARGTRYAVTDATSPTYLGALTGGGTVYAPVVCNGTAWVSY